MIQYKKIIEYDKAVLYISALLIVVFIITSIGVAILLNPVYNLEQWIIGLFIWLMPVYVSVFLILKRRKVTYKKIRGVNK